MCSTIISFPWHMPERERGKGRTEKEIDREKEKGVRGREYERENSL